MENSLGEIKRRMGMALLPATHNRGNPETQRLFQANLDRRWLVERLEKAEADLDDVPDLVAKLSTTRQARDALAKLLIVKGKCVRCGCGDDKHDGTCDAIPYLLDVALDEEWLRGIQEEHDAI